MLALAFDEPCSRASFNPSMLTIKASTDADTVSATPVASTASFAEASSQETVHGAALLGGGDYFESLSTEQGGEVLYVALSTLDLNALKVRGKASDRHFFLYDRCVFCKSGRRVLGSMTRSRESSFGKYCPTVIKNRVRVRF